MEVGFLHDVLKVWNDTQYHVEAHRVVSGERVVSVRSCILDCVETYVRLCTRVLDRGQQNGRECGLCV